MSQEINQLKQQNAFLLERVQILNERHKFLARKDQTNVAFLDRLFLQTNPLPPRDSTRPANPFDGISFIVAAYEIPDQIQRTVLTCGPDYQNADASEIEVIIVDNGSSTPLTLADFKDHPHVSQVMRVDGQPSPVFGLNAAVKAAKFSTVAILIDGAHILTPGVFNNAKAVIQSFDNPVINVPQYILGLEAQNLKSDPDPFATETRDLADLGWPKNGYALFEYGLIQGENPDRPSLLSLETNCLITTKHVLETHGAFDERFDEPGAGMANLELFIRLTTQTENSYVMLSGEGSFHQDHEGTTTSPRPETRNEMVDRFQETYTKITGHEKALSPRPPFTYGAVPLSSLRMTTISQDYQRAKNKILTELADIYVQRTLIGLKGAAIPTLANGDASDESKVRYTVAPLGLTMPTAKKYDVEPAALSYMKILRRIHEALKPSLYFEIGIHKGNSLMLARCMSIGVDPDCYVSVSLPAPTRIFREESDRFFDVKQRCANLFKNKIDLAFLDGMHLSEFIIRDFMNTEKYMSTDGVIVIDDVYPEQMIMAERERNASAWCGDVYKIIPVLKKYRPDLQIDVFEAFIGPYRKGVVMITGLDPENRVLDEAYAEIEADVLSEKYSAKDMAELDAMMPLTSPADVEKIIANIGKASKPKTKSKSQTKPKPKTKA